MSKIYSFKDDDGNTVKYTVTDHLSINHHDYLVMRPESDKTHLEVYKLTNGSDGESLELVEDPTELSMIKSQSKSM